MSDRLEDLAREFAAARAETAKLRPKLKAAQQKVATLRPQIAAAIVEAVKAGRSQPEISKITGYTAERIRQICKDAAIDPPAGAAEPAE